MADLRDYVFVIISGFVSSKISTFSSLTDSIVSKLKSQIDGMASSSMDAHRQPQLPAAGSVGAPPPKPVQGSSLLTRIRGEQNRKTGRGGFDRRLA